MSRRLSNLPPPPSSEHPNQPKHTTLSTPTQPSPHLRKHSVVVHELLVFLHRLLLGASVPGAPVLQGVRLTVGLRDRELAELARVQGQQALDHVLLGVVELAHLCVSRVFCVLCFVLCEGLRWPAGRG